MKQQQTMTSDTPDNSQTEPRRSRRPWVPPTLREFDIATDTRLNINPGEDFLICS